MYAKAVFLRTPKPGEETILEFQTQEPTLLSTLSEEVSPFAETMLDYAQNKNLMNGIVIGVFRGDRSFVRVAGKGVGIESCFEIGSITKLFTIELLKEMVRKGSMRWSDPVSHHLSDELRLRNRDIPPADQITLSDLANHCSGLPIHPPSMRFTDGYNPFADFSSSDLLDYLGNTPMRRPTNTVYDYSNLGFAALGYAIESAAGTSYSEALRTQLLGPRRIENTYLALAARSLPQLVQGHSQAGRPVPRWTQDAYAPAGALCSTVNDLLRWMMGLDFDSGSNSQRFRSGPGTDDAYVGWALDDSGTFRFREGLTGGFSSAISLSTTRRLGLVVLSNRRCNSLMKALVINFSRLMERLPAPPLKGDYGMSSEQILEPLRSFKRRVHFLNSTWSSMRRLVR
jgi:CubicO group peptidase (beta-lactamase class C family)